MIKRLAGIFLLALATSALGTLGGGDAAVATHLCANTGSPFGPFALQTYEDGNYKTTYARALELAAFNRLFPELGSFALPRLETGPRAAGSAQSADPYVPPVLLKAVAWLESGWAQADYSVPYGGTGPTLTSHDCGYGIMQVTTGMQNISGVPNAEQAMIGGHYAFNIARGARILADKWNLAPEYRPIVGARDAGIIEDWYYALWGYNGFAFKNHPLNPAYSVTRLPYSCGPADDGLGHDRSQYPYQELVMGCASRPPYRSGTQLWSPQETHLPNLADPVFAGPLSLANWTPCSYDTRCAPMDMPTPNTAHRDPTGIGISRSAVLGSPVLSASSGRLSFQALPGQQSIAASVAVLNPGTGVLSWTASASAPWIKVSPVQGVSLGSDLGASPQSLRVYANAAQLPPGNHSGTITVQSLYAGGSPMTIEVSLDVSLQTTQQTGDFNGDGRTDLAYLCCGGYISVWFSNGDGTFAAKSFQPWEGYNTQAGSWKAGDFDGDGRTDLLHLCCLDYSHTWLSNGDGTFRIRRAQAWAGYNMTAGNWLTGDFDGDKRTDLAHVCCGGYWNVWTSRGDGSFRVSAFFLWQGYETRAGSWQSADVSGDGRDDLVHFCCQDYVHSWLSDGQGGFTPRLAAAPPGNPVLVGRWAAGDFNGDRRKDFLQTGGDEYARTWLSSGDGAYSVVRFSPWPGYGMGGSWQVGDFNGDSKDDVAHLCCGDYEQTWLSSGNGTYQVVHFSPWSGYGMMSGSWQTGDFTGDRRTDLLHLCCYYVNQWTAREAGRFTINTFLP